MKLSNVGSIERVIDGTQPIAVLRQGTGWSDTPPSQALILAGSFRPLHRAHRALLNAAWETTGRTTTRCFEISITNVEKPNITESDLAKRLAQFALDSDIVLVTRAATFLEKARLMPGATFVIGYDTAVRLFDDRFYDPSVGQSPAEIAMRELRDLGSGFVVGGRHDKDGVFKTLRDLHIPMGFEAMMQEIPETDFADPISSTQIRRSRQQS